MNYSFLFCSFIFHCFVFTQAPIVGTRILTTRCLLMHRAVAKSVLVRTFDEDVSTRASHESELNGNLESPRAFQSLMDVFMCLIRNVL